MHDFTRHIIYLPLELGVSWPLLLVALAILVAAYVKHREHGLLFLILAAAAILVARVFVAYGLHDTMSRIVQHRSTSFSADFRMNPERETASRAELLGNYGYFLQNLVAPAFAVAAAICFLSRRKAAPPSK